MSEEVVSAPNQEEIVAYKGFDSNLRCRGFQYEIGKTYTHEGKVEVCSSGFHSCEYPFDVFKYYPLACGNRFATIKASGQICRHEDDSKIASASLTVEAEIGLPELIVCAVDRVMSKLDKSIKQTFITGDQSAATNTGYRSAATNTGNWSVAMNTGDWSAATNTGVRSVAMNTGDWSVAEVNGSEAIAASFGIQGFARASSGGAIVLCHRGDDGRLIHIRASKVGENGIEPDVWYSLNEDGEFVKKEER